MRQSMRKRILSLLLTIVMILGFVPVTSLAAEQHSVTVTVRNAQGQAISGATVQPGSLSLTTDTDGKVVYSAEDGTHNLTVSAPGYASVSDTVTVKGANSSKEITLAASIQIQSFVRASVLQYNGQAQELVQVDSAAMPAGVLLTYAVDEGGYSATIPTAKEIGTYTVHVTAVQGNNRSSRDFTVSIGNNGISVTALSRRYDGKEHSALTLSGTQSTDTIQYSVDNGANWKNDCPVLREVKTLTSLGVRVLRDGAEIFKETGLTARITQNDQLQLKFVKGYSNYDVLEFASGNSVLDASATFSGAHPDNLKIIYGCSAVKTVSRDNGTTERGTTVNENGSVSFMSNSGKPTEAGLYEVYAKIVEPDGENNYSDAAKVLTLFVTVYDPGSADAPLVNFPDETLSYSLGSNPKTGELAANAGVPGLTASVTNQNAAVIPDGGSISYEITPKDENADWVAIDGTSGTFTVSETALQHIGQITPEEGLAEYTVTANKSASTYDYGSVRATATGTSVDIGERKVYDAASATYALVLQPSEMDTKATVSAFAIQETPQNGWYQTVTVQAKEGYKLAKEGDTAYQDEISFSDDGDEHMFFIQNIQQGIVSNRLALIDTDGNPIKIDGTKPDSFYITYSKVSVLSIIQEVLSLGFNPGGVRAAISAGDSGSGIAAIQIWASSEADGTTVTSNGTTYTLAADRKNAFVVTNADDSANELQVELVVSASGLQTQLLQAAAVDRAGNEQDTFLQKTVYTNQSEIQTNEDVTVIVDDQQPVIAVDNILARNAKNEEVVDSAETPLKIDYVQEKLPVSRFNPSVSQITVTFSVMDTNLVPGDTVVSVTGEDGSAVVTASDVTWNELAGGKQGSFTLSGDGAYTLKIAASDMAGNEVEFACTYILDTTKPDVAVTRETSVNQVNGTGYTNTDVVYRIEVSESNFREDNVAVECKQNGQNFTGGTLRKWTEENGKHIATYTIPKKNNGRFTLAVTVSDGLSADGNTMSGSQTTQAADMPVVIDTVKPVVTVAYTAGTDDKYYNFQPDDNGVLRTAVVTVDEINRADCAAEQIIASGIQVTDIAGTAIGQAVTYQDTNWVGNGQFVLNFTKEGIYKVDVLAGEAIKDLAGNPAVLKGSYEQEFVLDHTAPTVLLTYNIEKANQGTASSGTWLEKIVDGVRQLFGYWNNKIEVSVSIQDAVSGMGTASVTYTPFDGREGKTKTVTLAQDETDRKIFRGSFALPEYVYDSETEQLNGWLRVTATDKCGNENRVEEQGKHLVYDTISPKLSVSYAPTAQERSGYENTVFFAEPITATLEVQEKNFDVDILQVRSNGAEVPLTWKSTDAEGIRSNTASFVLGGTAENPEDGIYQLTVSGQDFAGNALIGDEVADSTYQSKKLVVDTQAPLLTDALATGTLRRSIGTTDYYMDPDGVHFTFSVNEHNFDPGLVTVTVTKNAKSAAAGTDYTISWSQRQDDPDIHDCDVHFTQDGEYTLTISGEDLAGSKLAAGADTVVTNGTYVYGRNIVLDNTAPELSLVYEPVADAKPGETKAGKQYISGKVRFTVTLKENFLNLEGGEAQDGLYLHIKKTENGVAAETERALSLEDLNLSASSYSQNRGTQTEYVYTWVEESDAEYEYTAYYTDYVKRDVTQAHNYTVSSAPETIPVIDTTAPQVTVLYADGLNKQYYNLQDLQTQTNEDGCRTAAVTLRERNLDPDLVTNEYLLTDPFLQATDVGGNSVKNADTVTTAVVSETDTEHVWSYVFAAEANYVFDLVKKGEDGKTVLRDLAGNEAELTADCVNYEKVFTIDRTAPSAQKAAQDQTDAKTGPGTIQVTYNIPLENGEEKWYTSLWNKIRFGFWNVPVEITLSCYDDIAGIENEAFTYTFTRADDLHNGKNAVLVSKSNAETFSGKVQFAQDGETKNLYKAVVRLPEDVLKTVENPDGLEKDAQLDGTFAITLQDRCGNESSYNGKPADEDAEETRVIFDTIAPTRTITLKSVVAHNGGKSYFANDITGTVSVTEANFFIDNGRTNMVDTGYDTTWVSTNADYHVGTFKISGEGTYEVNVTGRDYAGNEMRPWKSEELVIDMTIEPPEITVNGENADGNAYKDEASLGISYFDENFKSASVTISRTRMGEKDVDVTETFTKTVDEDESGGFTSFDSFEAIPENDGIYVVTAVVEDWAGHRASSTATFSVNRFGSIYTYEDYLLSIIKNGGMYIKRVDQDLVIHEFNADRLTGDVKIQITRDGKPLTNVIYTSNAVENLLSTGESGWFEYTHVISKENFKEDGLYKISVSSQDFAGNRPENTNMEGMSIQFYVDSTPPELTSVTGLEQAIVNAETVDVQFTAYDTIGLKSVKVYLDGEVCEEETDFAEDRNNYTSGLTLKESPKAQNVRIVLEDLAGNVLDTAAPDFHSAYTMVKEITVSTSFWVRFYANKPLMYGCIIAVVALLLIIAIAVPTTIAYKKRGKYSNRR